MITSTDRIMIIPNGGNLIVKIDGAIAGILKRDSYDHWIGDLEAKIPQASMQLYGLAIDCAETPREVLGQVQDFIWGDFEDL